jgi:hypothetical protein
LQVRKDSARAQIALDEIDELVVEIAVVHRRDEREHRDEHRKVDNDRRANPGLVFAH